MTLLSLAEQRAVVAEASRAPSVHNVQPARWRFVDDSVVLFRAIDRALPVADPTGHAPRRVWARRSDVHALSRAASPRFCRGCGDLTARDALGLARVDRPGRGEQSDPLAPWV